MVWYDKSRHRYRIRWLEKFTIKEKSFLIRNYDTPEQAYNSAKSYLETEIPKITNYIKYGDLVEISSQQYYNLSKRISVAFKSSSIGIDFKLKEVSIDPYALGYWLGDGHTDSTNITTDDEEIRQYFNGFAEQLSIVMTIKNKFMFNIVSGTGKVGANTWRNFLKGYKLFGNKHIPDDYKFNSKENRLKLLAGLIDSDEYNSHNTYDFCLKSEKLVDDLMFVARSLGYYVAGKQKVRKTCTNGKDSPVTGDYFRFFICGSGLEEIPCLLTRKVAYEMRSKKDTCVNSVTIVSVGKCKCYTIELENNSRYLLDDFTIIGKS